MSGKWETGARESDDETAQLIPIGQSEPADGVKIGGTSSYFPWTWDEDPELPPPLLFPWAAVVWAVLAVMAGTAVWAAVTGR